MRYIRYQRRGRATYGLLEGDTVRRIQGDIFAKHSLTDETVGFDRCRLLAPCQPSKVIGVGRNFKHLFPRPGDVPKYPLLFLKLPTSVIGAHDSILYPSPVTGSIFEAELAVVIGRRAVDVPEQDAPGYIFGYTCLNDVSSREYRLEGLPDAGPGGAIVKACDHFAPMGPCIATDIDPAHVQLRSWLNGELKQDANTSDLLFGPAQVVSFVSRFFTLLPGDVITLGTPTGFVIMRAGDTIECEASGIGRLKNVVKARPR
ncbi:MAG: fumarylacetoacetate hydrolase family protein [Planctomycetes bacterium]|nr:fumarylacetoacetate hydrolase family protein [Planctomycetota bacterium]